MFRIQKDELHSIMVCKFSKYFVFIFQSYKKANKISFICIDEMHEMETRF